MLYRQPLVAQDLPRAPQPWVDPHVAETCLPEILTEGAFVWSLASPPTPPTTRIQQRPGHRKTFPDFEGATVTERSPQNGDQVGRRTDNPQERPWESLGMQASRWLSADTSPQRLVHAWRRGPGERSLVSPRMICHCLMRLMSPGGWYAAVLGHSLEADAHGNGGKGGGVGGDLGVEHCSPARWFPLICGRGQEQGRLAPPSSSSLPHPHSYWGRMQKRVCRPGRLRAGKRGLWVRGQPSCLLL